MLDTMESATAVAMHDRESGETIVTSVIESPVGPLFAAAIDEGICMLEFASEERLASQQDALRRWIGGDAANGSHPHLATLRDELAAYFNGSLEQFTVPLAMRGTPFELRVWRALLTIPYGATASYADIARAVDSPKAVRAVGSANGRNRIAIVIPCHRVINSGGKLGGYGGGLLRKEQLLALESRGDRKAARRRWS